MDSTPAEPVVLEPAVSNKGAALQAPSRESEDNGVKLKGRLRKKEYIGGDSIRRLLAVVDESDTVDNR